MLCQSNRMHDAVVSKLIADRAVLPATAWHLVLTYRHARVSSSGLWTRREPAVMCRSIGFFNIDNTGCTEIYSRIARYSLR